MLNIFVTFLFDAQKNCFLITEGKSNQKSRCTGCRINNSFQ